jgi:hypothetical protein
MLLLLYVNDVVLVLVSAGSNDAVNAINGQIEMQC